MTPFFSFLKNMAQLILSPHNGWEDIELADEKSQSLMEHGFYPMLAVMAVTAFIHGLYGAEPFSYGAQLQFAIVQVAGIFAAMMIARGIMETLLRHFTDSTAPVERMNIVCVYCFSLMCLVNIIENLCPIYLALFWFLPAFVAIVAWQSRDYLGISRFRLGQFIVFAILVFVFLPIAIQWLLGLII